MKHLILGFALLALSACASLQPSPASCTSAKVDGMSCEACAMAITQNLKKLPSVKDVKIDVTTGTIDIYSNDNISISSESIKSIVDKSGFKFVSLNPKCSL